MYFLASICLLNFLTVRGTDEEKTPYQKFNAKMSEELGESFARVKNTDAYKKCQEEYKKKYENITWKPKPVFLKDECFLQEDNICVATNDKTTNFGEKLEGLNKELYLGTRKEYATACRTMKIGNDNCKADCEKISSASTVTTTVLFALSALAFLSK
jgi:hypothetical protein